MSRVRIEYCSLCHFAEPAHKVADHLQQTLGLESDIHSSTWGAFRILLDDKVIYNRWTDGGWFGWMGFGTNVTPEEIERRIRALGTTS